MDIKILFLCNEILGFLERMKNNENMNSVEMVDIYFRFTYESDNVNITMVDEAVFELTKRGLIERENDNITSLHPGLMIEI